MALLFYALAFIRPLTRMTSYLAPRHFVERHLAHQQKSATLVKYKCYAECRSSAIMLSDVMLRGVMLNVTILCDVMLTVGILSDVI